MTDESTATNEPPKPMRRIAIMAEGVVYIFQQEEPDTDSDDLREVLIDAFEMDKKKLTETRIVTLVDDPTLRDPTFPFPDNPLKLIDSGEYILISVFRLGLGNVRL